MLIKELKFQRGCYLAFVLSEESKKTLLKLCPPSFSKVICHHVTIIFGVTEDQLKKYQSQHPSDPEVKATGLVIGKDIECLTVTIGGEEKREDGGLYHITLSLEPPAKPVDSNKLLKQSDATRINFKSPVKLDGKFELVK